MQNPRDLISNYLNNFLERNSISADFDVTVQENPNFGDYSTNIALVAFKEILHSVQNDKPKSPHDLAGKIISFLNESEEIKESFRKIEIAGAGFINFYLSEKYLTNNLSVITDEKDQYGLSNVRTNVRMIVEFGDPNPFKQIHIGHLRNFCIGESFSRLLESQGNEVIRVNYQGDVGMHVAKSLWAILQNQKSKIKNQKLTAENLASAYAYGAAEFEKNEEAKKEIQALNKEIYEEIGSPSAGSGQSDVQLLWENGREVSLESFKKIYERIGITYDKYYFESETAKRGRQIVLDNIESGIFERDNGAVIYRGENDGLHTRVFLTSEDYATYEAKDLALAVMKDEDLHYDRSIILTGNEQAQYFQVMLAALGKISPELSERTTHLTFGHVRLKDGKMSSRTGDVITAEWLMDEAVARVKENFKEVESEAAEKIGIGAVKYSMLKFAIPSDIHFDFSESISLTGNSGPYLQYTYVRTLSVLTKIKNQKSKIKNTTQNLKLDNLEKEEDELLRFLSFYPYFVGKAANEFAPNVICGYLFDLAQKFNLFYEKHKIIGSEHEEFRLTLTKATGEVLKSGLNLLGIETVEKM